MNRLYRSLAHNYSEGGVGLLFTKVVGAVLRNFWSNTEWLLYELSPTEPVSKQPFTTLHRLLTFDDLVRLGYSKALAFPENVKRRYSRGDLCHGFFASEQLVTVGWSGANYMELNTDETLDCRSAWGLFDFLTMPTFQSRGYYTDALRHLTLLANESNFHSLCIAVHPANIPSIKGIERAGFRLSKKISKRRILGVSVLNQDTLNH
jgi:hypothetical protein